MPTISNTFEGGTNAAVITTANSGGASGTAFDTINTDVNGTMTFDSSKAAHGNLSLKFATNATGGGPYVSWSSAAGVSAPTLYARSYVQFSALPAANTNFIRLLSGTTIVATVRVTTTGKLGLLYSSGTVVGTTTASVPLNSWFRVEVSATAGATAGACSMRLFNTPDSTTATETLQISNVNVGSAANIDRTRIGMVNSTASFTMWADDVGMTDVGWMGPSGVTPPPVTFNATAFMPFF